MQKRTFMEMQVAGIALDPTNNAPIVVLKDVPGKIILPIWIGIMEASSIAAALEGLSYARPMTHDLIAALLKKMDARVSKIEIVDIKDNVFYALIVLEFGGETLSIDARPSDAIAIALRTKARIFVANHVVKEATHVEEEPHTGDKIAVGFEQNQDKLQDILEKMDPEDFGKFRA
jgi:uncharacterized protein